MKRILKIVTIVIVILILVFIYVNVNYNIIGPGKNYIATSFPL